jgi:hypothetical protein
MLHCEQADKISSKITGSTIEVPFLEGALSVAIVYYEQALGSLWARRSRGIALV